MDSDRDAIELLQQTAVKAEEAKLVHHDEAAHRRDFLLPSGSLHAVTDEVPPRNHVVFDIESLSTFVADEKDVVVWHDDDEVIAVLDDTKYRDSRVTMPLPVHPTFSALAGCKNPMSQRSLIDFLRLNLKKELETAAPGFIAAIREVRIVSNEAGDASIQHGRESMGKRIEQSVTGVDAIPEELTIRVRLWLHLEVEVDVDCALVIDTSAATFKFGPKPGAVEQAKVAGQKWLGEQLESACKDATVFFGKPEK